VGAATNAVINVPAGTYLLLPTNHSGIYSYSSILLQRGGINFVGAGTNNTILLSQGAWTLIGGAATRGFLVEFAAPMTNNNPISFSYLTMDGGVQQGNTANHSFPASTLTGSGWDETHSAFLSWIVNVSPNDYPNAYFTNDLVQHWRGEEFKSIDQPLNCHIQIVNCRFTDGNATALNVYPSWNVISNEFDNLLQVAEYYQQYYSYPTYFEYNLITNITGNGFAINGGSGTNQPLTIASNTFYFSGNNGIETTPADNLSITGNTFWLTNFNETIVLGSAGYQGTFDNSNIVISANTFYNPDTIIEIPGTSPNQTESVQVCSNLVYGGNSSGGFAALIVYGWCTNVVFYQNDFYTHVTVNEVYFASGANDSQYVTVETNNIYRRVIYNFASPVTNILSYSHGPRYQTTHDAAGDVYVLSDSDSNQLPPAAQMVIDNSTNSGASYTLYLNSAMTRSNSVANGQIQAYYWSGKAWLLEKAAAK
jgi:hypothetical protein